MKTDFDGRSLAITRPAYWVPGLPQSPLFYSEVSARLAAIAAVQGGLTTDRVIMRLDPEGYIFRGRVIIGGGKLLAGLGLVEWRFAEGAELGEARAQLARMRGEA